MTNSSVFRENFATVHRFLISTDWPWSALIEPSQAKRYGTVHLLNIFLATAAKKNTTMRLHVYTQRARLRLLQLAHPERVARGDPFRQIFIDPRPIGLMQRALRPDDGRGAPLRDGVFCRKRASGLVVGGDWHSKVSAFRPDQGLLFRALYDRYHRHAE